VIQHNGAIPGFSSSVTFFPNDEFGIAILTNTADKDTFNQAITMRIAEDVLGLERSPQTKDPKANYPERPHRNTNASSLLPLNAYAGTYRNPGYGSFTLCAPSSSSHYCTKVLEDFAVVESVQSAPLPSDSTAARLYAEWSRFWSTHIRMLHLEESTFHVALTALFPQGYGANKTPFETFDSEVDTYAGHAKFVLGKGGEVVGFGFFGSDDSDMRRAVGDATGVKDSSIAWFEKVS